MLTNHAFVYLMQYYRIVAHRIYEAVAYFSGPTLRELSRLPINTGSFSSYGLT